MIGGTRVAVPKPRFLAPPAKPPRFRLRPGWHRAAICRGCDWRLWFPHNARSAEAELAKSLCESCPVRKFCAQDALNHEDSLPESGVIRAGVYIASPTKRTPERQEKRAEAIAKLEMIAAGVLVDTQQSMQ